jgi:ABC-type Zn2+ transport system substrate-binding protein/surface adhesin
MSKTQPLSRTGNKWSVSECLRLEREYDLLKLPIQEIADLHGRSVSAIMYKLDKENIADYNELYTQYMSQEADEDEDEDEYEESDEDEEEAYQTEDNGEESDEDSDKEFDLYNMKQQMRILSKQMKYLTEFIYKSLGKKISLNVSEI